MPGLLVALLRCLPLLAADDGGGGGDPPRDKARATDVHDRYNGDAMRIAEKLAETLNDNYDVRDKNRQLRAELDAAKGKLVPDGATVLTGEDATRWAAYQALGKPDELKTALKERETVMGELAGLKRADAVRQAAAAERLNADALLALPNLPPIIVKDVTGEDGTVTKRAFVTPEGGTETPLTTYGKQQHAALWPAVETATGDDKTATGGTTPRLPRQPAAGGGSARADVAGDYISRRYTPPTKPSS